MTIIFDGRFANGATFADYHSIALDPSDADQPPLADGRPGMYEMVPDPLGGGDLVAKLTMQASTSGGRCELRPFYEDMDGGPPNHGRRWYAWSMLIPGNWTAPASYAADVDDDLRSSSHCIIAQLHDIADVGDTAHFPPWDLFIDQPYTDRGMRYKVGLTYDANATTTSRAPNSRVLGPIAVQQDVWVEWALDYTYAHDGTGAIAMYKDRRLIFSVTGPTAYNDAEGPFWKFGLYSYSPPTWTASRSVYTRGAVVGDENSSYLEVTGHVALETAVIREMA